MMLSPLVTRQQWTWYLQCDAELRPIGLFLDKSSFDTTALKNSRPNLLRPHRRQSNKRTDVYTEKSPPQIPSAMGGSFKTHTPSIPAAV